MGRIISQSVGEALSARDRALQDGTPKFLAQGEQRACYAMLSCNTTSTVGGVVFFDKYFQPVRASTLTFSLSSPNDGNYQYSNNGDAQTYSWLMGTGNVSGTQNPPSTSATSNYLNGTNVAGEFGNSMIDVYSNSTAAPAGVRNASWNNKYYSNAMFLNSDHADKSIVYILNGNVVRAISRINGNYLYNFRNTKEHTLTGLHTNMMGSASYNAVRKELVILSYSTTATFTLTIMKGVDFNKYPSPAVALTQPDVVTNTKSVVLPTFSVSNAESQYNLKPVLCDNGDIYITVMFTGSEFALYKVVRASDDTPTATKVTQKTLTTSYGLEQGIYYGQRIIQSRDGGAVLAGCAYYYYGAGLYTFVIDRRKSTYYNSSALDSSNTSSGFIMLPYGDQGFASYFAGNVYAGSPTGSYIPGIVDRVNTNDTFGQSSTTIFLPYFTGPNTTNYPGFTQVVDYSMLTNQNIV